MMKQLLLLALLFIAGPAAMAQTDAAEAVAVQAPYTIEPPTTFHEEGILSFHANLVIYPSGLLMVEEKIKVYARGENIRKGIFRTIPMFRIDRYGRKVRMGLQVNAVTKNGASEPYNESTENEYLKIRIGDADVTLDEGIYEYVITYETAGQIGFFDGYDELYWNVTGNGWQFNIDSASATVTFPSGAHLLQSACYTGVAGSKETDCHMETGNSGTRIFRANRPLASGEGFTIAAGFTAGIITRPPPPTAMELFWERLLRYKEYALAVLGGLIFFFYGLITWRKHGKDPVKPIVVPTFEPPGSLSPGAMRYIYKRSADNTGFTATIVNMAIKKAIHIKKDDDGEFTLENANHTAPAFAPEEQKIFTKLFNSRKKIKVTDSQHRTFSSAQEAFRDSVNDQFDLKEYFLKNTKQVLTGGLIVAAIIVGFLLATHVGEFFFLLFLLPFLGVGGSVLVAGIRSIKDGCTGWVLVFVGALFTIVPLGVFYFAVGHMAPFALLFTCLMLAGYFWYIYLIKAPTRKGAAQQAQIEGFEMYLKTAEEHRLNMLTTPERTPELFEKLLPYAIALDLENEWGAKFETVLEQAAYSPEWYDGEPIQYGRLGSSFSTGFLSSMNQAKVDPTPPPSSSSSSSGSSSGSSSWSSGSSGGGSSGGGGGGGGGGW